MPDKVVNTGDGGQYIYHPVLSRHSGHDDHGEKHHREHHTNPTDPIQTERVKHEILHPTTSKPLSVSLTTQLTDKAHLVLKGVLANDEYYIRCIDESAPDDDEWDDMFWVDRNGNISANYINSQTTTAHAQHLTAIDASVETNTEDIEDLTDYLGNAASNNVPGTLVLRDSQGDIEVRRLTANRIISTGAANSIDIYGDGALWYVPLIDDPANSGTSIPDLTATYRFGRNIEEPGELGGAGDGLEMKHNDQELLIQVQDDNSTIFLKGNKTVDSARFIEIHDSGGTEIFYVDRDGDVLSRNIHCESLVPLSGAFEEIRVDRIRTRNKSMWLGDRLHVTETGGRGRLQYRNASVPVYLQGLGVQPGDLPTGITLETATLDHWIALSEANSGSSNIDIIFPEANEHIDFDRKTTLNELKIQPEQKHATTGAFQATQNAGITIEQSSLATGGQPFLNLQGSEAGTGAGLIHFETMVSGSPQTVASLMGVKATGGNDKYFQLLVPHGDLELQAFESGGLGGTVKLIGTTVQVTGALDVTGDVDFTGSLKQNGVPFSAASAEATEVVYVDVSFSGTSDGSALGPYKSLVTALTAKLVDTSTTPYLFKLAPGTYSGAVSITHTNKIQSFTIDGSGSNNTFIEAAGSDVLFFRRFKDVTISNLCIQNGKYGFYPRNCKRATARNVRFTKLGSNGVVAEHDQSGNQAAQAAVWASGTTSDGGACRIREVEVVTVQDCEVDYCLRGLRIQDCGSGGNSIVSGCKTFRTLESGIYLAAGSYTGTDGCDNFMITGNTVLEAFNNGILVIGGKGNTVQGNNIIGAASAGIQLWHSLDCTVQGNSVFDCNRLTYNGIGNLADAHANIEVAGNTNIGTGTYMCTLLNNTILKCNQGRADAVYGIRIQRAGGAYPTASNKFISADNYTDAATALYNEQSIPETSVVAASGGAANLSDNQLHLESDGATPTVVRVTQDWDDGATSTDTCRIALEQIRGSDPNSAVNTVYEWRISRADQNNMYLSHRDKWDDVITNDDKLLVFKPSSNHIGIGTAAGFGGGSHQYNDAGICLKAECFTWGSMNVGKYGTQVGRVLRLHDDVGFVTQDANGVDTDVLAQIAANTAFSQAPAQPVLYVQGSASSYTNNTVDCAATTRTVMFHAHGNSGDYWLNLPRYADVVDGMTIRVFGGHTTGTGKAFIRTHYLDVAINSNYGLYEASTELTNGQYSVMDLKQTLFTCVYHSLHTKWWVYGHSTA